MKSDDVVGRVKTYEAIIKGENIPEPGVPESFKVLLKELQSLGLDVRVLHNNEEVEIRESVDSGNTDFRSIIEGDSRRNRQDENFAAHGYTQQEIQGDEFVDVQEDIDEEDEISFDDDEFATFDEIEDEE